MNFDPSEWVGLIPAAGKGVRLGLPYPKELYPVIRDNRYKPVSQFILENMLSAGIKHVVFVINETKGQLIGFFGSGRRFNCEISYVVQEPLESNDNSTSPGLADALDAAYHLTCGKIVYFGMADTIIHPIDALAKARERMESEDDVMLCLFPIDHPEKGGMTRCQGDVVVEIIDKPKKTDLTHTWGCMIWKPGFTEHLHRCVMEGMTDFAVIMNLAIQKGFRFRATTDSDFSYIDLGTYEEIMALDRRLRND